MAYLEQAGLESDRQAARFGRSGPHSRDARDLRLVPSSLCPEIDCLRGRLPAPTIAAAEQRARDLGVGADEVLIAHGVISEDDYVRALARSLGTHVDPLDLATRIACPHDDDHLLRAAAGGPLPLRVGGDTTWLFTPRGLHARFLVQYLALNRELRARPRLAAPSRMRRFVTHHAAPDYGQRAADQLKSEHPEFSAANDRPFQTRVMLAIGAILAATILVAASGVYLAAAALTSAVFVAWIMLRLCSVVIAPPRFRKRDIPDHELPVYTVIVPLYREARAVPDLIAALRALDYPPEKLDIKLVLEPDDPDTLRAIEQPKPPPQFDIVIAPAAGPRTKPKALNAALLLARGSHVVVYDAEDRPAHDQLRRALDAFATDEQRLACVQARLTIDNLSKNWLVRSFLAEYAGQFDVLLPALARLKLPLPLGGSSNHFKTDVLRKIGGWDAYNVTEDADLGIRLARFGYRATVIASTTCEEAPDRLGPWLRQRTRWFKGWIQTWRVHMRAPHRTFAELGPLGFAAFHLTLGGSLLAALAYPWFLIQFVRMLYAFDPSSWQSPAAILHLIAIGGGFCVSAALGLCGLLRRGAPQHAWVLLLMPLHWCLLSCAAWRAVVQVVRDPHSWEKTEHGLVDRPTFRKSLTGWQP